MVYNNIFNSIIYFSLVDVDTSANRYTQCEDITIVAIRIMRVKEIDEQRKIKIDCAII